MASIIRKLFRSKNEKQKDSRQKDATKLSYSPKKLIQQLQKDGGHAQSAKDLSETSHLSKSRRGKVCISNPVPIHAAAVRSKRLMKEYQDLCKSSEKAGPSKIFSVELVDENLFDWNVKLFRIDPESELYRDMLETNTKCIVLNLTFPENFPFSPPFMRVLSPRIHKGFVMDGGAICMELLTPRGWASAYTIEALIVQFAASVVKGQGRIVRKSKMSRDFSKKVAESSFKTLVRTHEKYGWVTPPLSDG